MIVFYKLNSAIERGTKPDALGWKPCHWTNTLKAAMVGLQALLKVNIETIASLPGFGMAPEGHFLYSSGPNM
jgi:hypothetical protein